MTKERDTRYIAMLLVLAVLSHTNWFDPSSIINYSDWLYFPDKAIGELNSGWTAWISFWNFGAPNIQFYFYPFKFIWYLFAQMGLSYDTAAKFTFFIPIAVMGFLTPYILAIKLFKSRIIAFSLALYYGSTTYFLIKQISHIPVAFVYSAAPLVFYSFMQCVEKNRKQDWILFSMLLSVVTWYEARITLLVLGIVILYGLFFYFTQIRKYLVNAMLSFLLFVVINLFWIIPTFFTPVITTVNSVASRGVFGDFLFDLNHAITLSEFSWTGSLPNMTFSLQPVFWYLWIIPLISLLPLTVIKSFTHRHRIRLLFFLSLVIIGVFLTKQSDYPFSWSYRMLYEHVPPFRLYREASKFYFLTAFGYFGLLGYSIKSMKYLPIFLTISTHIMKRVCVVIILILSLINLFPLFTKSIGTTFISNPIPTEFTDINYTIINDDTFYRTIWLDSCCQYISFDSNHPRVEGLVFINFMRDILNIRDDGTDTYERYIKLLADPAVKDALSLSSVRYIAIPTGDSNSINATKNREIAQQMISTNYFKQSNFSNDLIHIFEIDSFAPLLYRSEHKLTLNYTQPFHKIAVNRYSPSRMNFTLSNLSKKEYVHFSEAYHPSWKLYLGDHQWYDIMLHNRPLKNTYHIENPISMNSYLIDPEFIRQNYSKNNYTVNNDGSINVTFTLFFFPQSIFYLSLFLSIIFMFITGVVYIYYLTRNHE